jgi:hypothetical protein
MTAGCFLFADPLVPFSPISAFIAVVSYVRTWTFWWGGGAAPPKCPNRYGYRYNWGEDFVTLPSFLISNSK